MLNTKSFFALFTTSLLISACGGNNSESKGSDKNRTAPFTTEFESNLTLQKDADPMIQLLGRSSNQDASFNAYSVTHHFDKGSTSIILSFNFDKDDATNTLYVNYDPILKKVLDISMGENYLSEKIHNLSKPDLFACAESFVFDSCKNISVKYDETTGYSEVTFTNTKLSTPKITRLSPIDENNPPLIEKSDIYLNGKLSGTLSVPPQNFNNIRKTSQFTISANQQPIALMGATYDPETHAIFFSSHINNGIDADLKLGKFSTFIKDKATLDSLLQTTTLYGLSGACMSAVLTLPVNQTSTIQPVENTDYMTLDFNQAIYSSKEELPLFPNFPIQQDCAKTILQLDGSVRVNKPFTQLQITPILKNEDTLHSVQPALYFDVTNHNIQKFGNDTIDVSILDNKIKKINFKATRTIPNPSTGLLLVDVEYHYGCDVAQPCQGVSYNPENNQVNFKNTILTLKDTSTAEVNENIILNGVFDFAGR
ncbi:hypothetical protein [Acinetobacter sp. HZNU-JH01]|uniref:hypothetical protein n=1 Tax=Acinetobacter sp. HZNU-JH01 TaxID=3136280 RepID=UPI0030F49B79